MSSMHELLLLNEAMSTLVRVCFSFLFFLLHTLIDTLVRAPCRGLEGDIDTQWPDRADLNTSLFTE